MHTAGQNELTFDEAATWERKVREPGLAWQAFSIYRDLGPTRSLSEAYRRSLAVKEQGQPQPALISSVSLAQSNPGTVLSPPSSWKRWRVIWQWDERCAAFDTQAERERQNADKLATEARRKQRLEQLLSLDTIRFNRILVMHGKVDELLVGQLSKARESAEIDGKIRTLEYDKLRAFEVLADQLGLLEDRYFREITPEAGAESVDGMIQEVVGEFAWVPDPDVPAQIEESRVEEPK